MQAIQFVQMLSPEQLLAKGLLPGLDARTLETLFPSSQVVPPPKRSALEVHRELLELGSRMTSSPKWKGPQGNATEEFIKWRNRF